MSERVDKGWNSRGIDCYAVPAILGTLTHYGVPMTEERFLELAKEHYPLALAQQWHEHWKGTGQFSRFPAAAAEELWRRLKQGEVAPTDVALAIINLLTSLEKALDQKKDDGTWETRFKVVENYLPTLPTDEARRDRFLAEVVGALNDLMEVFDTMAEALARKAQPALADRFVAIEESIFPVRKGTAAAFVKAGKGDEPGAIADFIAIAADTKREDFARLCAIDGLINFKQLDEAKRFTLELLDRAEQLKDVELASETVERLAELLKSDPKMKDRNDIRERVEKLSRTLGEE